MPGKGTACDYDSVTTTVYVILMNDFHTYARVSYLASSSIPPSPRSQSMRRRLESLHASVGGGGGGGLAGGASSVAGSLFRGSLAALARVCLPGRTLMAPGIGDVVVPVYDQGEVIHQVWDIL